MNFFDTLLQAMAPEAYDAQDYENLDVARGRLNEALGKLAEHYKIVQIPSRDGEYRVTADYGHAGKKLSMNKTALGLFTDALLRHGGTITSIHTMSRSVKNAYVQAMVKIPAANIQKFVDETGFELFEPPTLTLA